MPRLKGRQSKIGLPVTLIILVTIGGLIPLKYVGMTSYKLDTRHSKTPAANAPTPALVQQDAVDSIDRIKR